MYVMASYVLFSRLKRTKYHSSTPGIERLISLIGQEVARPSVSTFMCDARLGTDDETIK